MISALRVVLVTDGRGDADRLLALARAAIAGGVRTIQVREPRLSARELAGVCQQIRGMMLPVDGIVLVNDRIDIAAAGCADGAHIGHRSLPPDLARRALPRPALLTAAAHDPDELARAATECDWALLAAVWPTASKPRVEPIGPHKAGLWTEQAARPVVWLGGVTAARARSIADLPPAQRPAGVAVLGAICGAADPEQQARELVHACAWATAQA